VDVAAVIEKKNSLQLNRCHQKSVSIFVWIFVCPYLLYSFFEFETDQHRTLAEKLPIFSPSRKLHRIMGNCCFTQSTDAMIAQQTEQTVQNVQNANSVKGNVQMSLAKEDLSTIPNSEDRLSEESPFRLSLKTHSNLDSPGDSQSIRIGNYDLRYAYVSKQGYYPEGKEINQKHALLHKSTFSYSARKKPNQDSYYCETHFAGDTQKAFFAVFDGHGQYGDVCSQFAAEKVWLYSKSYKLISLILLTSSMS
jgi:hypothetical protein